jgi:hypothetical protein
MLIISLTRLDEWIKVFNDTFYIAYLALIYNFWWPHWYIQLYMIHVVSDLRQDDGFLRVPRSLQAIKLTDMMI